MVVEMSHSNSLPEIFSGDVDLGLGLGLRPGSLPDPPPVSSPNSPSIFDSVIAGDLFTWSHVDSLPSSGVTDHDRTLAAKESGQGAISARVSGMFGRISEKLRPKRSSIRKRNSDSVCNQHVWAAESSAELPSTGDSIPIGSSLRQQRILYEKDIGEILRRRQAECETRLFSKPGDSNTSDNTRGNMQDLLLRLEAAQLEVELLRQELETYESRLVSKEQAIHILKQQSQVINTGRRKSADDAQLKSDLLIKELNSVQFELEYRQNSLINSQQIWVNRFNSLCKENEELKATVERQSLQMRQLYAENMLMCRERDGLSALLDARERCLLDKLSSPHHDTEDNRRCGGAVKPKSTEQVGEMAMIKVAILGACHCGPDPCECAVVATKFAQDVTRLTDEIELAIIQRNEAVITCDAYRVAFEEQLNRNRLLLRKLVDSQHFIKTRHVRASGDSPAATAANGLPPLPVETPTGRSADEDFLISLVDMVNDRSEALAHQRLATNLLALKTQQLEGRLSRLDSRSGEQHQQQQVSASDSDDCGPISSAASTVDIYLDAVESV